MSTKAIQAAQELKELKARMKELEQDQAKFTDKETKLTPRIGAKGTINIYGAARNPICLYFSQMVKLQKLFNNPEFQQFLADNKESLAMKE